MGSYIHTCGNLHESLLLAIQGTIAYAISPHAVLTDWTARTTSCRCIAVFDYKRNAQANDTLSSIEAHIGPERLKRVGSLSQPKAPLKSAIENGKGLLGELGYKSPIPRGRTCPAFTCPERCGYAKLGISTSTARVSRATSLSSPCLPLRPNKLSCIPQLFLLPLTIA
jgi:hypothetical protein